MRRSPAIDLGTASVVSFAAHACAALAIVAGVRWLGGPVEGWGRQARPAVSREIGLPEVSRALLAEPGTVEISVPADEHREGGVTVARLDAARSGRGGDPEVDRAAQNLADRDDRTTLTSSSLSSLTSEQLARIDASTRRSAWEDRRASTEPMELTFVAMGERPTGHDERRPDAAFFPGAGPRAGEGASEVAAAQLSGLGRAAPRQGEAAGGATRATAAGVDGRRGGRSAVAAPQASARPQVDRGEVSVPADAPGRPRDTLDSEQAVAARTQSLVHASTAGGHVGVGVGGQAGGGAPGAGGARGPGSKSAPLGPGGAGAGDVVRVGYVRAVQAKVHPLWAGAFPSWAIADGLSGHAIVTFTVDANGRIVGAAVTRRSQVPEFDRNVLAAVQRAAPFGPLPASLGPRLTISMPFVADNPAVRRVHESR